MRNNHTRAFPDLVSVEAWHSSVKGRTSRSLHVDVSFSEAKIGDDPQVKVRFSLSVRAAEISFCTAEDSKIQVIQSSVAREPMLKGKLEFSEKSQSHGDAKASASIKLANKPSASAELSAATSLKTEKSEIAKFTKEVSDFEWRHKKDRAGHHCWSVTSSRGATLIGKPWDPIKQPMLNFQAPADSGALNEPPCIRIKCRREDLVISALEPKELDAYRRMISGMKKNKIAAAEAAIKAILEEEGLEFSQVSENYAIINIADSYVLPEVI